MRLGQRPIWPIVLVLGAMAAFGVAGRSQPAEATPPPNFVVILTDDQRWDTIGRCTPSFDGSDLAAGAGSCMPNLQADLIANGVTFLKGEVSQALCCPSRASILSGQYSAHTTVKGITDFAEFDDASSLATWLHDAGYRTGLFGKYLNGYPSSSGDGYIPPGWDAFHSYHNYGGSDDPYSNYSWVDWDAGDPAPVVGRNLDSASTTEEACAPGNFYSTDLICYQGLEFLAANTTQPFFLYLSPASPHQPPIPAERHSGAFAGVAAPQYPDYNSVPTPNPPAYMPTSPLSQATLNTAANGLRKSLETNLAVDDMIDAVYDALAADGRLENTVFVFLSDNGIAIGEKRHTSKSCAFMVCHRVPFVVLCPPAICPGAASGVTDPDNYALNIDIAPTIADLAGVTPGLRVDGQSLRAILNDQGAEWRSKWLIYESDPRVDGLVATAADGRTYKYLQTSVMETLLFDLTADPWELANRSGDEALATVETSMQVMLADALSIPVAAIDSGPPSLGSQTSVTYAFSASEDVNFECRLDNGPIEPCGSGLSGTIEYPDLGAGQHSFSVTAVDPWNNVADLQRVFTIDTTNPPPPTLTQAPPATSSPTATFSFVTAEPGVTYFCSLDGVGASCVTPQVYTGLADGSHSFTVSSVDGAGNTSAPTSHTWTVSSALPSVTVTMTAPAVDQLATTTSVRPAWTGSTNIIRYDVYERLGVGATPTLVQSSKARSFVRTGVPGTTYCYLVIGFTSAGHTGTGDLRCIAVPADDRSQIIVYSGDVAQTSATGPFLGTLTVLNGVGEESSFTFTGRKVGVILVKDGASGKAQIWLDGSLVATLDLYSRRVTNLSYVWTATPSNLEHTVRIVWTGTKNSRSTGTGISVDGIAFISG